MKRPLFSLVHATARHPGGWIEALETWRDRCDDPTRVEYILCADRGREMEMGRSGQEWAKFAFGMGPSVVFNDGRRCAVDAWNTAAAASTGDILITVADDYFPPEHWDTEIERSLDYRFAACWSAPFTPKAFVLDVDNQDNSAPLLPFSFVSRAYYEKLGYLFWPEYFGLGADNDFTEVARRDGVVIDARHLKFEHRHPDRGGRVSDSVDAWQHRPEAVEAQYRIFERRQTEGFPPLGAEAAYEYYRNQLKLATLPSGLQLTA